MARKRNTESDVSAGAAPAPSRRRVAAKTHATHSNTPVENHPASSPAPAIAEPPSATAFQPSREEIARLAHAYWESRGGHGGSPEQDWLRAEQELRVRALAANA